MITTVLFLILGLCLIVFGADVLVDGASAIARKVHISEFVIGLTIVGFGTSCPELVVSLTGAVAGNADISIGNVIGSNIFNILCIVGLTAVLSPLTISNANRKTDVPVALIATILLLAFGMNRTLLKLGKADELMWIEGVLFLLFFAAYMFYCFTSKSADNHEEVPSKQRKLAVAILFVLAGLAGLIFGGKMFVNSATEIAHSIGVSDKFIAITILAGGTSLPELATCLAAALKGKSQLAIGNIIGSNVFNILLIIGLSAVITPLSFAAITILDAGALLLSIVLLLLFSYTGRKCVIERWEGAVLLACCVAYYTFLFIS